MNFADTFLALTVLGAINAGHLAWLHITEKPMVCPLDHDCSVVTKSRWSTMLGVRNEFWGTLFFVAEFIAALCLVLNPRESTTLGLTHWIFYATVGGFIYSLYLVGLQIFVIKDYCFYCMVSALITTLLFINSLAFIL